MLAVDTSVLLSIFKGETDGAAWLTCLQREAASRQLVACAVVWAEVRAFFRDDASCRQALEALGVQLSPDDESTALLAGSIYRSYKSKGGTRTALVPDFLVAAHAATHATALATTDRGYLRNYFPKLALITSPI